MDRFSLSAMYFLFTVTLAASESTTGLQSQNSEFSDSSNAVVTTPLGNISRTSQVSSRTVEVDGVGDTPDAARKDAVRLALQQVVGMFLDNQRRIEENISDAKISEVVNEKIISYTNGYVNRIEILRTQKKDDLFEVTAKIEVGITPILKVLQDNALPVVNFDTASAASAVEALSAEKSDATKLYSDLIDKIENLLNVGIGTPQVDASLFSSPDEAWLRLPVTFSVNQDVEQEWRSKFELFAQKRAEIPIKETNLTFLGCDISLPYVGGSYYGPQDDFLAEKPAGDQEGVAACFSSSGPSGVVAQCLGRNFAKADEQYCQPDKPCINFQYRAKNIRLIFEFLGSSGAAVYTANMDFKSFPVFTMSKTTKQPRGRENVFFNYCLPSQSPFFAVWSPSGGDRFVPFGDTIVFPPPGSKIRAYVNFRLKNEIISQITSVTARIVKVNP
jgi:hypothetical protein